MRSDVSKVNVIHVITVIDANNSTRYHSRMTKLRLDIYPPPELVAAIDKWRGAQRDVPTRAEAVRRLVEVGLQVKAPAKPARGAKGRNHG